MSPLAIRLIAARMRESGHRHTAEALEAFADELEAAS